MTDDLQRIMTAVGTLTEEDYRHSLDWLLGYSEACSRLADAIGPCGCEHEPAEVTP